MKNKLIKDIWYMLTQTISFLVAMVCIIAAMPIAALIAIFKTANRMAKFMLRQWWD